MARHRQDGFERTGSFAGINRRDLDRILLRLGGTIEFPRRTGDVLYRHPLLPHPARANARRKDASRHLVLFVGEVENRIAASTAAGDSSAA